MHRCSTVYRCIFPDFMHRLSELSNGLKSLAGWLAGRSVSWLVGWSVSLLLGFGFDYNIYFIDLSFSRNAGYVICVSSEAENTDVVHWAIKPQRLVTQFTSPPIAHFMGY